MLFASNTSSFVEYTIAKWKNSNRCEMITFSSFVLLPNDTISAYKIFTSGVIVKIFTESERFLGFVRITVKAFGSVSETFRIVQHKTFRFRSVITRVRSPAARDIQNWPQTRELTQSDIKHSGYAYV